MGVLRPDHVRRRASRARLRPAGRHQALARGPVPAAAGRPHGARPQPGQLLRRGRAVGLRHGRARRRHRLLGRQDAAGPDAVLLGHAALPRRAELPAAARQRAAGEARGPHQPARRPDDLLRRRRAAQNQHVNYEPSSHGRPARRRRSPRRTTTSGSRAISAATRPPAPRTTTSRPASATAASRTGSATT